MDEVMEWGATAIRWSAGSRVLSAKTYEYFISDLSRRKPIHRYGRAASRPKIRVRKSKSRQGRQKIAHAFKRG
jgi:hypothetical protein